MGGGGEFLTIGYGNFSVEEQGFDGGGQSCDGGIP